ncbi:putative Chaperonin 10-like protein [Seiridium cardinale]|uniref:Chaperonin 10-like protein n=1 Tax=Seiridium cardinale TaxID=138064 RepID=A0ABR2Y1J7_9PEZI
MKEAIVSKGTKVQIVDSPIPKPKADEVVIKVVYAGSNPKDWKVPEWFDSTSNQGDDVAGTIHEVGSDVTEFKKGDRVMGFHVMMSPHGAWAEYSVVPAHTTVHLPAQTSFEQGAAIPLAALTAALGLYSRLRLPEPWQAAKEPIPLVVYGAASAVGIYTIQLALKSNIHPLICVAGKSQDHVKSFIDPSKGDTIVDYRDGDEAVIEGIRKASNGAKLLHAYDAVSEKGSYQNLGKVLDKGSKVTLVLPGKNYDDVPEHVETTVTHVGCVHQDEKDFGFVYFRYIGRGLQEGWFKPQPTKVVPGGLAGVKPALEELKAGRVNAQKLVFEIAATEGVN